MSYAQTAKDVKVRGLNGARCLAFEGSLPHGAGKRYVAVHVDPLRILELAAALLSCPGAIDEPVHAIWHIEHPDKPRPCAGRRLDRKARAAAVANEKLHDALAIAHEERARILLLLEDRATRLERECADVGTPLRGAPGTQVARAQQNGRRAFGIGLLRGVAKAIEDGEHVKA